MGETAAELRPSGEESARHRRGQPTLHGGTGGGGNSVKRETTGRRRETERDRDAKSETPNR